MLESLVTPKKTVGLACGFACPPTSSLYKYVLFPCPLFFILSFLVESVLHHCVCSFITALCDDSSAAFFRGWRNREGLSEKSSSSTILETLFRRAFLCRSDVVFSYKRASLCSCLRCWFSSVWIFPFYFSHFSNSSSPWLDRARTFRSISSLHLELLLWMTLSFLAALYCLVHCSFRLFKGHLCLLSYLFTLNIVLRVHTLSLVCFNTWKSVFSTNFSLFPGETVSLVQLGNHIAWVLSPRTTPGHHVAVNRKCFHS